MIARLAIIQSHNPNYYYTIQTLTDVQNGKTELLVARQLLVLFAFDRTVKYICREKGTRFQIKPYTEFSASLYMVWFEIRGLFPAFIAVVSHFHANKTNQLYYSVFPFWTSANSFISILTEIAILPFELWEQKSWDEAGRDETRRVETRQEECRGVVQKIAQGKWCFTQCSPDYMFRCGRGSGVGVVCVTRYTL